MCKFIRLALYSMGLLCLGWISFSCHREFVSHQTTDQLLTLAGDNTQPDRQRLLIFDNLLAQPLETQQKMQLGRQLSDIVVSLGHSPLIRKRALEIIIERYPENAPVWLGKALLNTPEPDLRDELIAVLIKLGDKHAISYLILAGYEFNADFHSFINAIELIADEPVENVLILEYVRGAEWKNKIAALAGLKRHFGPEHTISIIQNLPNDDFPDDELHDLVRFWVEHFNFIPSNIPQFFLGQTQKNLISPSQWNDLQQKTTWLTTHYNYQFDLADAYILLQSEKTQFLPTRDEISEQIAHRLAMLPHSYRPPSYPGAADDYREDFIGPRNLFSYTDLLRIRLILNALTRPDTVKQLRRFLLEDMDDLDSEVGGLCFLDDDSGTVRFQAYRPQARCADNTYVESPQMLRDACLCLTRWHCHADRRETSLPAGPGLDDLQFAEYYGTSLLIITYINAKIFNVDYCNAQGEVLDLGNY